MSCDQRLNPRDYGERLVLLLSLARGYPARLLIRRNKFALDGVVEQAVPLRELIVFNADARDTRPLVVSHRPHYVVEAAEPVVAVGDNGKPGRRVDTPCGSERLRHRQEVEIW